MKFPKVTKITRNTEIVDSENPVVTMPALFDKDEMIVGTVVHKGNLILTTNKWLYTVGEGKIKPLELERVD